MISEISPFKDFVCIKVCHNHRVWCFEIVLVCPCLYTNRTSKELQTLLCLFFFRNLSLQIGGAAYLWVRLIHGTLRYIESCKRDKQTLIDNTKNRKSGASPDVMWLFIQCSLFIIESTFLLCKLVLKLQGYAILFVTCRLMLSLQLKNDNRILTMNLIYKWTTD